MCEVRLKGAVRNAPSGTTTVPPPALRTASTAFSKASVLSVALSGTAPKELRLNVGPALPP
jgi:hypothetical protein